MQEAAVPAAQIVVINYIHNGKLVVEHDDTEVQVGHVRVGTIAAAQLVQLGNCSGHAKRLNQRMSHAVRDCWCRATPV